MPEVYFHIEWPDGTEENCYSPSTVIHEYLRAGETYPLPQFLNQVEQGLTRASERVQSKFGYYCSSASDQLVRIKARASAYAQVDDARVTVKSIN